MAVGNSPATAIIWTVRRENPVNPATSPAWMRESVIPSPTPAVLLWLGSWGSFRHYIVESEDGAPDTHL